MSLQSYGLEVFSNPHHDPWLLRGRLLLFNRLLVSRLVTVLERHAVISRVQPLNLLTCNPTMVWIKLTLVQHQAYQLEKILAQLASDRMCLILYLFNSIFGKTQKVYKNNIKLRVLDKCLTIIWLPKNFFLNY